MVDKNPSDIGAISMKLDGDIFRIRINRESEGNILSFDMISALAAQIRVGSAGKIVALSSSGPDFCLGRDLSDKPSMQTAVEFRERLTQPIMDLYEAIATSPVPVICAVQGRAIGLGCALTTICDITLAADNASFRLPELASNLPPTLAISAMMERVPVKTLGWLVYSMREIGAQDARLAGMVSEVVPASSLEDACEALVRDLSKRSREALSAVKEYLRLAPALPPQAAAAYGTNLLASVLSSARR